MTVSTPSDPLHWPGSDRRSARSQRVHPIATSRDHAGRTGDSVRGPQALLHASFLHRHLWAIGRNAPSLNVKTSQKAAAKACRDRDQVLLEIEILGNLAE